MCVKRVIRVAAAGLLPALLAFSSYGQSDQAGLEEAPAEQEVISGAAGEAVPPEAARIETQTGMEQTMVPLKIRLPKARYIGTPQNIDAPHLQQRPWGKPRPTFYVPEGTANLALYSQVTGSDPEPVIGDYPLITDGDKEAQEGSYLELGPFLQHITIDLGFRAEIYAISVWHFHQFPAIYYDVVVQVAEDPEFTQNVHTVFNNDHDNSAGFGVGKDLHYVETYEGKLINARGYEGRYVRLFSNGNNCNDLNHYTEVEVYGLPVPAL